ncbi:MAG: Na+-transporting NADH:ubiquinone oxidoreductase, subunit NqrB, partial [Cyanobacteriota bacterium]|nr:Na+-transporting NADH:ubiquinone oxidoreductase, subunit NqrB [Cyanobacteriota bacterium]
MKFPDARDYQILFLALFLFLGISTRDWTLRWDVMSVAVASCCTTQLLLSFFISGDRHRTPADSTPPVGAQRDRLVRSLGSLRSALITALGLCLLLRANEPTTMAIAGCLAIASKFLFRIRGKHFFNPANFGIIAALLLTSDAWVSPGQWGTDWWYLLLFAGTGGMVLQKVG